MGSGADAEPLAQVVAGHPTSGAGQEDQPRHELGERRLACRQEEDGTGEATQSSSDGQGDET